MVKTRKNSDADVQKMRLKYSPLVEENEENRKKVDALFLKIFLEDFNLFTDVLVDARNIG